MCTMVQRIHAFWPWATAMQVCALKAQSNMCKAESNFVLHRASLHGWLAQHLANKCNILQNSAPILGSPGNNNIAVSFSRGSCMSLCPRPLDIIDNGLVQQQHGVDMQLQYCSHRLHTFGWQNEPAVPPTETGSDTPLTYLELREHRYRSINQH